MKPEQAIMGYGIELSAFEHAMSLKIINRINHESVYRELSHDDSSDNHADLWINGDKFYVGLSAIIPVHATGTMWRILDKTQANQLIVDGITAHFNLAVPERAKLAKYVFDHADNFFDAQA
ncbi:hypothetical protein ABTQ33_00600 [Paucilactobacillus suebicus]|uniref:Uncharacterized protein n=1 Tax=Paucilactobacillus suebicus DSM 5007 = KCTC 3549 TaxID=1423807 RepID=A0A0R1W5M0_9LACO|nr:hypothetical protein [Paucilactobacillus suebicus]KRM11419.1 hypothetical protein FD16_GL000718 [Paucilactobacillus suebicus DSM 5007 = KCTC 3549]